MKKEMPTAKYEIWVGFNDGETKEQKYAEEIYEKIITNVCKGYRISYSANKMIGGYIHKDGTFVKENSACITLVGATNQQVEEIAKDLCAFFNQESVTVIKSDITCSSISNNIFSNK